MTSPSQVHEQRKVKNFLLLGLLTLVVIFVFSITLVKVRFAEDDHKGIRTEEFEKINSIKQDIIGGNKPAAE